MVRISQLIPRQRGPSQKARVLALSVIPVWGDVCRRSGFFKVTLLRFRPPMYDLEVGKILIGLRFPFAAHRL